MLQSFHTKCSWAFYPAGKIRYSHNKWRVQADVFGGQIEHSTLFQYNGTVLTNTKIEVIIPRVSLAYRILDRDFKKPEAGNLQSFVYAGVKVFYTGIKATLPAPIPPIKAKTHWIDPVLGLTISYFWRAFTFTAQADQTPFDAFSSPSWWYQVHARYRFGKRISVQLGWVRQDFTKVTEVNTEELRANISLQGPLAGVAIHF